ncbi:MAG: hypothetical protein J6A01_09550 [Proteobacteria bacterium]|nr:hypothetical protein [Pseudomonadota bacterium]
MPESVIAHNHKTKSAAPNKIPKSLAQFKANEMYSQGYSISTAFKAGMNLFKQKPCEHL